MKLVQKNVIAVKLLMNLSLIHIYVRDYDQKVTNIYQETSTTPTIVLDTNPGESIYEAIAKGKVCLLYTSRCV